MDIDVIDRMIFIELTHHTTKKPVYIKINQIAAIFEVENSSYDHATRIILIGDDDYFDVDESYETVKNIIDEITSVKGVIKNVN